MDIQQNISLKPFNTLAINAQARYFVDINKKKQVPEAIAFAQQRQLPVLILGGGSNIVLTGNFPGLVIKMSLLGFEFIHAASEPRRVYVNAAAGENWQSLVQACLNKNYYGLENLSLIPGRVGAAPIQNIGAYGVALAHCFESLEGWDCDAGCWKTLNAKQCEFGYRDSVFKHALKDRFVITSVTLALSLDPQVQISYGVLKGELEKQGLNTVINAVTPQQVASTVIKIRRSKLPDPIETPNVGSFFKNPSISAESFSRVKKNYPQIVSYQQDNGCYKLAAGWMLEHAGWRGKKRGAVGMHSAQSLVLVNYGKATSQNVLDLAKHIQQDIQQQFGVLLEIEPAIY
ncbi:MAG: UDP-N-acetylmuramate dehydrogenase [Spongiibacteraceae bacterium]|nr:UDP-N-acetylmuramate dehydrogenase [Spongiibacteraceae bacterium]